MIIKIPNFRTFNDDEQRELYKQAQRGNIQSRSTLICSLLPLALTKTIKKHRTCGVEHDDLAGIAFLATVIAIDRYKPGKCPFGTWVIMQCDFAVQTYIRDKLHLIRPPQKRKPKPRSTLLSHNGKKLGRPCEDNRPLTREKLNLDIRNRMFSREPNPSFVAEIKELFKCAV